MKDPRIRISSLSRELVGFTKVIQLSAEQSLLAPFDLQRCSHLRFQSPRFGQSVTWNRLAFICVGSCLNLKCSIVYAVRYCVDFLANLASRLVHERSELINNFELGII